ncbi:MAG: NUDIX hydrolase, partial [Oscillospiraceae bacterium]|nr:NUDIX hydrolase [Oscillospiraceae bacterium]
MRNENSLRESPVRSETVYSGKILQLQRDTVLLPNGKTASRELIRHVGAVCVVPLTEENEVIVERQYRYPVAEVLTEIPAGKLDSKQEDRLEAARRELREETGVTADEMIDLGTF